MTPDQREALVDRVREACEREDARALVRLFSPDAVLLADTGGDLVLPVRAAHGPDVVPRLLEAVAGTALLVQQANGTCALVARREDRVVCIVSFGFEGGAITRVWVTLSPLKLRRWN